MRNFKAMLAFILVCLSSTCAQAAIIKSTAHGVITYGIDGMGLFGQAGADLKGLQYSQTISLDRALNVDGVFEGQAQSIGTSPATVATTVNNITFTRIVSPSSNGNGFAVVNKAFLGIDFKSDGISAVAQDFNATSGFQGYQYVFSKTPFVGAIADPGMHYLGVVQPGDEYYQNFVFFDFVLNISTTFDARSDSIEFNAVEASGSVPEPATAALISLGLIGFAVSRRKHS